MLGQSDDMRQLLGRFLETAPDGMVVVDADGRIVLANSHAERLFGYEPEALVGQAVEVLIPHRLHAAHAGHRARFTAEPRVRPMGIGLDLVGRRADGTEFPVEISLSPMETPEGALVTAAIRDTTERTRIEDDLKASLREKELLLREVHHRVKNNLQIINTLLALQGDFTADSRAQEALGESQNRIRSMALVHEKLYRSKRLSSLSLREYVADLAENLFQTYRPRASAAKLELDLEDLQLAIDPAIHVGLILNELISNSLKHAFPAGRPGRVRVALRREERAASLTVEDDGVGLPSEFLTASTRTLGLQLVRTLVTQLHGTLVIESDKGTRTTVRIPLEA